MASTSKAIGAHGGIIQPIRGGHEQDDSPVPAAAWALKSAADMDRVHAELMKRGIAIHRTHYVGAGPNSLLRAVVFANHRPEHINRLLSELKTLV